MGSRTWVMVDVEANGPHPWPYSMTEIGAVVVEPGLKRTFYGRLRPITQEHTAGAQAVCGHKFQDQMTWKLAEETMEQFRTWLTNIEGPWFVSDNNGFDWQFVNWYLHTYTGSNPFGHSSTNLGSLYKGLVCDFRQNFKHLRKTKHDHNPLNDAMGNAEAMLTIMSLMERQRHDLKMLGEHTVKDCFPKFHVNQTYEGLPHIPDSFPKQQDSRKLYS